MKKLFLLAVFLCVSFFAQAQNIEQTGLKIVSHEYVCMVNDRVFPNVQIPVIYEGKTYYGCCPMCKERLEKESAMRHARDPVSGRDVDKADAVIGAKPDGRVLYFETLENLKHYK